jgi:competence protein ComEA
MPTARESGTMIRDQQKVILFLGLTLVLVFFLRQSSSWRVSPHAFSTEEHGGPLPLRARGNITVEVDGKVRQRGIYQLEKGVTLSKAIERAGGPSPSFSLASEDLERRLDQNCRVNVQPAANEKGQGSVKMERFAPPKMMILSIPLDVNLATVEDLDILPGIGPLTARAIITYREANGPFHSPEDLMGVEGMGVKKLEAIRRYITLP